MQLHRLLLARERRAYESRHGTVGTHELLRLLLQDEVFAWLRSVPRCLTRTGSTETSTVFNRVNRP